MVVAYDGAASVTMYLDGSSLGPQTFASPLATVPDANGLLIGNDYWGSLSGSVDEVAVYPKALTAAQVLAHFSASGNSKPTAPTNVSATPGANQLTVTWNPSVTSPNAPVTQYIVTGMAGSRQQSVGVAGSVTSTTITGYVDTSAYWHFGSEPQRRCTRWWAMFSLWLRRLWT